MNKTIDLNGDVGEGFGVYTLGDDRSLLDHLTSANIACGFHGGDPLVMDRTLRWAYEKGVSVGAHPGLLDLWGFGRREILGHSAEEVGLMIRYQIGALRLMAAAVGVRLTHIKLHGALARMTFFDLNLSRVIVSMVVRSVPEVRFIVMPGSALEKICDEQGVGKIREVYADRGYNDDGFLIERGHSEGVLTDSERITERVTRVLQEERVFSVSGKPLPMTADSVCIHGDTPGAVALARRIRETLEAEGVTVIAFQKQSESSSAW